ncbi:unnamed protein product [Soboliphyme baturini]|uniref:LAM_G_DOMAIN domain-containing protein n=1 Tax=Soboliphyme baturini TaxID=241478 RepID=A0A183J740_9BILA|nr:unnamed protein product [Soboliphyme baturini]
MILLIDGRLFVRIRGHKMNTTSPVDSDSDVLLNDGQWHSLSVIKQGRQMSFQLDNDPAKYLKNLPRSLTLKAGGGLLIGGIPKKLAAQSEMVSVALLSPFAYFFVIVAAAFKGITGFIGCVKNFVFNGEVKDLLALKGKNVSPCRSNFSPGIYARKSNYMRFDYVFGTGLTSIDLKFRTELAADGLLVALLDPSKQFVFFTLELRNAVVSASLFSSQRAMEYIELSSLPSQSLCDDRWHHVLFTAKQQAYLTVDGVQTDRALFDGAPWNNKDCTMFVAGLPRVL